MRQIKLSENGDVLRPFLVAASLDERGWRKSAGSHRNANEAGNIHCDGGLELIRTGTNRCVVVCLRCLARFEMAYDSKSAMAIEKAVAKSRKEDQKKREK